MNAKTRRMEIELMTLGTGVIILSFWTLVKFALSFFVLGDFFDETMNASDLMIVYIVLWVFAVLSFLIHCYIGVSARSESKGKRKRGFYLVLALIVVLFGVLSVVGDVLLIFYAQDGYLSLAVTMIVDATTLVIMTELFVNAVGVRRYKKAIRKGETV